MINIAEQRERINATLVTSIASLRKANKAQDIGRIHERIARLTERLNDLNKIEDALPVCEAPKPKDAPAKFRRVIKQPRFNMWSQQ